MLSQFLPFTQEVRTMAKKKVAKKPAAKKTAKKKTMRKGCCGCK